MARRIETRRQMLAMPYDTNVWYHVTSELNLQSIRDHGLTPTGRGIANKNFPNFSVADSGVYLLPSISMAQLWASPGYSISQSEGYPGGEPVILKISNIDRSRLIPDPEDMDILYEMRDEGFDKEVGGVILKITDRLPSRPTSMNGKEVFDIIKTLNRQEREELLQFWITNYPTRAIVYIGTIPAQNISISSYYPKDSEVPIEELENFAVDDTENEFTTYENGTPRYKYQPMFAKKAMALRPEDLQAWIEENGPYAYHDTDTESVKGIIKNGLVPWNELPNASQIEEKYINGDGHLLPRPGFVYMHTKDVGHYHHNLDDGGARITIDLRKLDPSRFSADEDYVEAEYLKNPHNEMFEEMQSYPTSHPEWWAETGPETLGDWAEDNAHIVDDPDVTQQSLRNNKTIAYWGRILPEAIVDISL